MAARTYLIALVALVAIGLTAFSVLLGNSGGHGGTLTIATLPSIRSDEPEVAEDPAPPDSVHQLATGYSGTWEAREPAIAEGTASHPGGVPVRVKHQGVDRPLNGVAHHLAQANDYSESLRGLWQMCGRIEREHHQGAGTTTSYDILVTRFEREPIHLRDILFKAFAESSGVARQTLIFHIALALPETTAFPWLRELTKSPDLQDATDATCALAFRGDPVAMAAFEAMPPSRVNCRRIVDTADQHDALARAGEREFLRSYRCIEAMDCRPYFLRHPWAFKRGASEEFQGVYRVVSFPWADRLREAGRDEIEARASRLLPSWIRHFEGHGGTDDMCYRLARNALRDGDLVESAEWASLGATEPDEDMKAHCTALLLSLAEFHLSTQQLDAVISGRAWQRNRQLLQYIRLRREACQGGFQAGLDMAASLAAREPDSLIDEAWRCRWSQPPARGLKSGLAPLPEDDPLNARHGPEPEHKSLVNPSARFGSGRERRNYTEHRTSPPREAVQMSADYLAWQFRMWETQAELESRAARAFGEDRADLDYKVAAVFYHSVWVLYPVYASQLRNSGLPHPQAGDGGSSSADDRKRLMHEFREGASSLAQASRRFEKLADRHPHSALRDKALFSAGMARIKLVNDWPWSPIGSLLEYIPEGVRLFERVTAEHPDSSLADDAANAAAYWRRNFRHAFQPGSVVGRD